MNILLINHYAGSPYYGMEFRPYYLAREWVKQGHNVTIIAASFSHLRQHNPEVVKDFQEEEIERIKYVWFKTPEYGGSLARIKNMMTFVWKLQRNAKRIAKTYKPDLVIASSTYTLDNIPAYKIAKLARAKYTYEIHDLWPLSPMLIGGYSKYHPFILMMQWGEDYAYKHVDKVVSLLWNAEEHCKERGLAEGKFVYVRNGYNPEDWSEEKYKKQLSVEHTDAFERLKGKIIVGFAGGFVPSGSIDTLIKAAARLKDNEEVHFVLVGKGPEQSTYESIIRENNMHNVTILAPVPKQLIPVLVSHFDICFIGGVHSQLHKYGTAANKLTDYMLSSKPIIHAVDEPGAMIEQLNCGICTEAENVEQVYDAVVKLTSLSADERKVIGDRGKEFVEQNLKWSQLAENILNAFK